MNNIITLQYNEIKETFHKSPHVVKLTSTRYLPWACKLDNIPLNAMFVMWNKLSLYDMP